MRALWVRGRCTGGPGRRRPRPWLPALLALVAVWLPAAPAAAHAFAPALLELVETGTAGEVQVRFKQPAVRAAGSELLPLLPPSCRAAGGAESVREGTGVTVSWRLACPGGLTGQTVEVDGIAASRADVLLRIELADGRSIRHVLTADEPAFVVPEAGGAADLMRGYGLLGVEHILGGFDHLLFVLALVLLVRGGRRLVGTVTAFTVGHSVTLALAVVGWVRVPQQPVEALIAASIYLLAVELARPAKPHEGWIERAPWLVAGPFGLLHGLGFAGALAEVGLPAGEIPLALLSFNLGIEVGQLAFVAAVLVLRRGLRALPVPWPARAAYAPAYLIGSLAAFWVCERVAASFTGF